MFILSKIYYVSLWLNWTNVHPTCLGECWVNRSCNRQAFFSHSAVISTSLLCFCRHRSEGHTLTHTLTHTDTLRHTL